MRIKTKLDPHKRYLQIALNSTLKDAEDIINLLPSNDRIILEVGTPLIKRYGTSAITEIIQSYQTRAFGTATTINKNGFSTTNLLSLVAESMLKQFDTGSDLKNKKFRASQSINQQNTVPYIVADLKTMDRAEAEVRMVAQAGASAAIALGLAPIETLNSFVEQCEKYNIDPMVDMMNVDYPISILEKLKKVPPIIILHRGVDEEKFNKQKMLPLHEIRRLKGRFDALVAVAGGDTVREVQSAVFNDADIVVIWKSVFTSHQDTINLVEGFLKQIK